MPFESGRKKRYHPDDDERGRKVSVHE